MWHELGNVLTAAAATYHIDRGVIVHAGTGILPTRHVPAELTAQEMTARHLMYLCIEIHPSYYSQTPPKHFWYCTRCIINAHQAAIMHILLLNCWYSCTSRLLGKVRFYIRLANVAHLRLSTDPQVSSSITRSIPNQILQKNRDLEHVLS